jgi:2-C-methyl-D-erythritol 4-phosphate cytidylyltransferase
LTSAAAVITAAGSSSRLGQKQKKQYLLVNGLPVISKTLATFMQSDCFKHFIITLPRGEINYAKDLLFSSLKSLDLSTLTLIEGAESRQGSVFLALQALVPHSPEVVLIHDAARPWVSKDLIIRILDLTRIHGACIPVTDFPDAIKKIDSQGYIEGNFTKQVIKGAQTPQGFIFPKILEAYHQAQKINMHCADDAEIYALYGQAIYTIPGDPQNRKITYAWDMEQ